MVTKQQVLAALCQCFDPEIQVDVVSLGLIYGLVIHENWISVTMTLTDRWCPTSSWIEQNIRTRLLEIPDVLDTAIHFVWEPAWNPTMMTKEVDKNIQWISSVEKIMLAENRYLVK